MRGIFPRGEEALKMVYAVERKPSIVGGGQMMRRVERWDWNLSKPNFGRSCRLTWGTETLFFFRWYTLVLTTSNMVRFGRPKGPPCSAKSGLGVEANMEAGVGLIRRRGEAWLRKGLGQQTLTSSPLRGAGQSRGVALQRLLTVCTTSI